MVPLRLSTPLSLTFHHIENRLDVNQARVRGRPRSMQAEDKSKCREASGARYRSTYCTQAHTIEHKHRRQHLEGFACMSSAWLGSSERRHSGPGGSTLPSSRALVQNFHASGLNYGRWLPESCVKEPCDGVFNILALKKVAATTRNRMPPQQLSRPCAVMLRITIAILKVQGTRRSTQTLLCSVRFGSAIGPGLLEGSSFPEVE
nr:hypothetical protein CFP56_23886 [Quercus suber]